MTGIKQRTRKLFYNPTDFGMNVFKNMPIYNNMKHILKYTTLCCSCLAYGSAVGYGSPNDVLYPNIFPTTKTLGNLPAGYIENLHKFLCKKVLQGHAKDNDAATFIMDMGLRNANRFACAFVAKTNQNRSLTIYINDIPPQKFNRDDEEKLGTVSGFDAKKYKYTNNATESTDVKEKIFSEGSFKSTNLLPLYWSIKESSEILTWVGRIYNLFGFDRGSDLKRLCCERNRVDRYRAGSGDGPYNNDSEFHALYALGKTVETIAERFKSLLSAGERITSIEFHGCATRDMCPVCYTQMNAMQILATVRFKTRRGTLGRLITQCQKMEIAEKECQSATFISSIKKLKPSNLLLPDYTKDVTIVNGYVHQFRFPYQDVLNIQETNENTLRSAANVYDLNANGFPSGAVQAIPLGGIGTVPSKAQADTDTVKSLDNNDPSKSLNQDSFNGTDRKAQINTDTVKSSDNNDPSKSLNQDPFNGTDRFPASKAQADTDTGKSSDNNDPSKSLNQDPFNSTDRFSVSKAQINTDIVKSPDYNDFSQSLKK